MNLASPELQTNVTFFIRAEHCKLKINKKPIIVKSHTMLGWSIQNSDWARSSRLIYTSYVPYSPRKQDASNRATAPNLLESHNPPRPKPSFSRPPPPAISSYSDGSLHRPRRARRQVLPRPRPSLRRPLPPGTHTPLSPVPPGQGLATNPLLLPLLKRSTTRFAGRVPGRRHRRLALRYPPPRPSLPQ